MKELINNPVGVFLLFIVMAIFAYAIYAVIQIIWNSRFSMFHTAVAAIVSNRFEKKLSRAIIRIINSNSFDQWISALVFAVEGQQEENRIAIALLHDNKTLKSTICEVVTKILQEDIKIKENCNDFCNNFIFYHHPIMGKSASFKEYIETPVCAMLWNAFKGTRRDAITIHAIGIRIPIITAFIMSGINEKEENANGCNDYNAKGNLPQKEGVNA